MSLDDCKRRIRSLLALAAPNSGATDAERDTARRMAEKLMREHGLAEKDIPERRVARPQPAPPSPPNVALPIVVRVYVGGFNGSNTTTNSGWGFSW